MTNEPTVICFGEVLWDLLPTGKTAGGAPMNVAFHTNNFGLNSKIISRVGEDELGKEILNFLSGKGIDTDFVQIDGFYPTGTVVVSLDENGSPSYKIAKPIAWDYINLDLENEKAVRETDAFVYGSLACRTQRTRETLFRLLELAQIKIFDVNLRAPFYSQELLENLLQKSDIVKMNEEELALIGAWFFQEKDLPNLALKVKHHFDISILIVTQGAAGAFAIDELDEITTIEAKKIVVKDTVGSGDAFLAGFLCQYLNDEPMVLCLDFAVRTGALVATMEGGTPRIDEDMVSAVR